MEAPFRTVVGWILASLLIFASLHRSEAISFSTRPEKPYVVVVGVNDTDRDLVWDLDPDAGETVQSIKFQRVKSDGDSAAEPTLLASRLPNAAFTVFDPYKKDYDAKLDYRLRIKRVTNDQEYIYSIVISYVKNNVPLTERDRVSVVVKVPPKITLVPQRQPFVEVGKNLTLTCNASGDPHPQILWTKGGVAAKDYNVSGYRLHLVKAERTDVGSYKCTANNGYGIATSLSVVSVKCPTDGCQTKTVAITITDDQKWPWKPAYNNRDSIEYKMLQSNLTSAIAIVYTKNSNEQLYEQAITELRSGSIVIHVQLLFGSGVNDPLKPLRDEVATGELGSIFNVSKVLVVDPTLPPSTTAPGETTTASNVTADTGARTDSGLTNAEMWGIIGGCLAFLVVIVIIILICCCCRKNKSSRGGATKSKSYSEADGYRMNKQPPSSGLGTASPAYVEARMYAPANAARRQDDQSTPNNINYTEPYFDKSSDKQPPPRYPGTEYSEMSPEKRPPSAGGGGQGEGGFELWC